MIYEGSCDTEVMTELYHNGNKLHFTIH